MADKRYYWLKLDESFFEDDTIAWLEEQENGKDYVIFYLKLCLKSLQNDGKLIRYVGETLIPYDVTALSRLTNTNVDTVRTAMSLFVKIGLVKQLDTGEIYMNQINEMIGTETDVAKRVRKHRAKNIVIGQQKAKLLQCNTDVTKCNTEIEKEIDIYIDHFDTFWKAYPKKVGKGAAEKSFKKLKVDKDLLDVMLKAIENQKQSKQWSDKQFIPNPSTWLNQRRWEDEVEEVKTGMIQQEDGSFKLE